MDTTIEYGLIGALPKIFQHLHPPQARCQSSIPAFVPPKCHSWMVGPRDRSSHLPTIGRDGFHLPNGPWHHTGLPSMGGPYRHKDDQRHIHPQQELLPVLQEHCTGMLLHTQWECRCTIQSVKLSNPHRMEFNDVNPWNPWPTSKSLTNFRMRTASRTWCGYLTVTHCFAAPCHPATHPRCSSTKLSNAKRSNTWARYHTLRIKHRDRQPPPCAATHLPSNGIWHVGRDGHQDISNPQDIHSQSIRTYTYSNQTTKHIGTKWVWQGPEYLQHSRRSQGHGQWHDDNGHPSGRCSSNHWQYLRIGPSWQVYHHLRWNHRGNQTTVGKSNCHDVTDGGNVIHASPYPTHRTIRSLQTLPGVSHPTTCYSNASIIPRGWL